MKKLSAFLYSKTNLFIVVLLMILMGAYAAIIMGGKSECFQSQLGEGMKVFGLKMGLTMEYAKAFFKSLNADGLKCYKELILVWDNIFPVFYCLMYLAIVSFIYKNIDFKGINLRIINLFPLVPAVMDWIENIFEIRLINNFIEFSEISQNDVILSSTVSHIKWACSYLNYFIITIGLIILISQLIKRRKESKN